MSGQRTVFFRSSPVRGMTLVELLISISIITILMGAFMWMLLAGKSTYQSSTTHTQNRQDMQVACQKLAQDMKESDFNTIYYKNSSGLQAVSFLSARDNKGDFVTDTIGAPVWQKYVIYYIPVNSARLIRREVYGSFSDHLSDSTLTSYCNGTGTVMTQALSAFTCTPSSTRKTCNISLTLKRTNDHGKNDQQSFSVMVYFRNQVASSQNHDDGHGDWTNDEHDDGHNDEYDDEHDDEHDDGHDGEHDDGHDGEHDDGHDGEHDDEHD